MAFLTKIYDCLGFVLVGCSPILATTHMGEENTKLGFFYLLGPILHRYKTLSTYTIALISTIIQTLSNNPNIEQ